MEVQKIESIDQISEKETRCKVRFKAKVANSESGTGNGYVETILTVIFQFKKNTTNNWILTCVVAQASKVMVNENYLNKFHEQSQNLTIAAE